MGTPEFAVPSLDILLNNGYHIVGVVTSLDKWGGRGRKTRMVSAVKRYAMEKEIAVLQPKNLKSSEFNAELAALGADLQIVVAFRMLPEVVWSMPPMGTINLHGSLLPKYRGAAPINWAIINGESTTGLTTFFIQHAIDTGDLLFQSEVPIYQDDTAGDLHDRMKHIGADLVLKTVNQVVDGKYQTIEQNHAAATKAPKLKHEMCEIDPSKSGEYLYNFVRGLNPWPVAWLPWGDGQLKVYKTSLTSKKLAPGQIERDEKSLYLGTGTGALALKEVQLTGRKRMSIRDFLNGQSILPTQVGSST
ncbi:MAG: methionyl-tRNA formyltransferase [Saprospiraceae bacterium]|nr:methionyl-tRNA formyltransferase [Saprospiraceae bacterium]